VALGSEHQSYQLPNKKIATPAYSPSPTLERMFCYQLEFFQHSVPSLLSSQDYIPLKITERGLRIVITMSETKSGNVMFMMLYEAPKKAELLDGLIWLILGVFLIVGWKVAF